MIKNPEKKQKRVYFDWAASAPNIDFSENTLYGNPSSKHSEGRAAKAAIEDARERCAAVLKVPPETLYFTSGGTESNSIALFSNLTRKGHGRILASMAEHASIREGMETLAKMGKPCGKIEVDASGRVTAETFERALDKNSDTAGSVRFVSIMSVNNETGAVTDIPSIKDVIRKKTDSGRPPIHFHCDLVQAVGKIPFDIQTWEIDSASISAHKIGGHRGIGLLYLRKPLEIFYSGGGQEKGVRGGTENVMGAIALANCLEDCVTKQQELGNREWGVGSRESGEKFEPMLKYFFQAEKRWNKLMTALSNIDRCTLIPKNRSAPITPLPTPHSLLPTSHSPLPTPNSLHPTPHSPLPTPNFSPYILQAAFKGIPGEVMARALDDLGFAVSTGSACSSSSNERPVLAAMGVDETLRMEGIRISQGYTTTDKDIDLLVGAITEVLKFL